MLPALSCVDNNFRLVVLFLFEIMSYPWRIERSFLFHRLPVVTVECKAGRGKRIHSVADRKGRHGNIGLEALEIVNDETWIWCRSSVTAGHLSPGVAYNEIWAIFIDLTNLAMINKQGGNWKKLGLKCSNCYIQFRLDELSRATRITHSFQLYQKTELERKRVRIIYISRDDLLQIWIPPSSSFTFYNCSHLLNLFLFLQSIPSLSILFDSRTSAQSSLSTVYYTFIRRYVFQVLPFVVFVQKIVAVLFAACWTYFLYSVSALAFLSFFCSRIDEGWTWGLDYVHSYAYAAASSFCFGYTGTRDE